MTLFFLGILFDETLRRVVIPWLRRHPSYVPAVRGALLGYQFRPASTRGMYYMSGGSAFADTLKSYGAQKATEAQEQLAKQMIDNFASELLSGALGPVDQECRDALKRHIAAHRAREQLSGFGLRSLWRRRGGGAPAPGPAPAAPPPAPTDDGAAADDTQGMLQSPDRQMVVDLIGAASLPDPRARQLALAGAVRRRRARASGFRGRPTAASTGWSLFSSPASKLLVSAVPGGTTAVAAHAIATKALKSGALKPEHLKRAGDLARRGRAGDQGALVQIAKIKQAAGRGDRNAEIALDRVKLAHCLQTGQRCRPGTAHGGGLRAHYAAGVELMRLHPHA